MEIESIFEGKLLVDSRYLERDDNGYLYHKGKPFTGLEGDFRKDGTLDAYIEYFDSYPHGKSEAWYESGQLKEECFYVEGCTVGIRKEWYESGQLKLQVEKGTPPDYILKEWYESGQIKKELHFIGFKTQLLKEWDEAGHLIKEENASNEACH